MDEYVLYSYCRSAVAHRVRIALNLKGIEYRYQPVDIIASENVEQKALLAVNPRGQVPCLVHRGHPLVQSMAIVDYLDHVVPNPALFPSEPVARAQVLAVCEAINSDISPLHSLDTLSALQERFGADAAAQSDWAAHWIADGFEYLERLLTLSSRKYSFGETVCAADLFLVPAIYRANRFGVDMKQFPTVSRIGRACSELDAFQRAAPERQPDATEHLQLKLAEANETIQMLMTA